MLVGVEYKLATGIGLAWSGEGADQHQEGALRQVKVGDQTVHDQEWLWGMQEDAGASGLHCGQRGWTIRGSVVGIAPVKVLPSAGDRFEDAGGGGTDGDDASAAGAGGVDEIGGGLGQGEPFDVHLVVSEEVDLDREERAGADVEGEVGGLDAGLVEGLDEFRGEVEAGGGSGDGSGVAGIDGLIPFLVEAGGRAGGTLDIGRQREFAVTFGEGYGFGFEEEEAMTLCILVEEGGVEGIGIGAEAEGGAGADAFAGAEQDPPLERGGFFEEQDFDLAPGIGFEAADASGDDLGIVEDQEITWAKPLKQAGEVGIVVLTGGSVQDQEA